MKATNQRPEEHNMNNLVMTWTQAVNEWNKTILPFIQTEYEADGIPDWPARREGWNNWTDMLCKDGQISDWQYANWSQAPSCGA